MFLDWPTGVAISVISASPSKSGSHLVPVDLHDVRSQRVDRRLTRRCPPVGHPQARPPANGRGPSPRPSGGEPLSHHGWLVDLAAGASASGSTAIRSPTLAAWIVASTSPPTGASATTAGSRTSPVDPSADGLKSRPG